MMKQYFSSKLLNVLFVKEYAKRATFNVEICSTNPSLTQTEIGTKDGKGEIVTAPPSLGITPRYVGAFNLLTTAICVQI